MSPIEMRREARLENLQELRDFATDACLACGGAPEVCNMLELAVDEACTNVVMHAYDGLPPGEIIMTFDCVAEEAIVTISDFGHPFSPDDLPPPNLDAPWDERPIGGLGVHLIRQTMDEATYTSDPQTGNRLLLRKRLRPASEDEMPKRNVDGDSKA